MKINGLNNDDFEWIDKAFRFLMSNQGKQIKGAVECGSPEMTRDNMGSLEDVLKVYEKIQKEIRKYEKRLKFHTFCLIERSLKCHCIVLAKITQ